MFWLFGAVKMSESKRSLLRPVLWPNDGVCVRSSWTKGRRASNQAAESLANKSTLPPNPPNEFSIWKAKRPKDPFSGDSPWFVDLTQWAPDPSVWNARPCGAQQKQMRRQKSQAMIIESTDFSDWAWLAEGVTDFSNWTRGIGQIPDLDCPTMELLLVGSLKSYSMFKRDQSKS